MTFRPDKDYDAAAATLTTRLREHSSAVAWDVPDSLALYQRKRTDYIARDVYLVRAERNKRFVEMPVTGNMLRDTEFDVAEFISKRALYMLGDIQARHNPD